MNNEVTIIVIGIYTLVYVIVFFVQKSQLKSVNEINLSMKSFMDIFKIEEVKKYVEMKDETIKMKFENMVADDEKITKIANEAILSNVDVLKDIYKKQMGEEHMELVTFVVNVINSQPKEKRVDIIKNELPKTKRYLLKIFEDIDNNKI